ncbi:hypothetical protein PV342_08415 [Streptomyces sp. PA03-3a]|nr:hypothetical protein [Streptomyces sp. PA03-3a]
MSTRYEVVFSCYLSDDTPEWVMAALRWHLGMDADFPDGLDDQDGQLYPLLVPDSYANRRLPGGDAVSLHREVQEFTNHGELYEWELFARNHWVDDSMLYLRSLLDLLAPHIARPGYGGHFRDIHDTDVTIFDFRDGTYEPIEIWGVDPL